MVGVAAAVDEDSTKAKVWKWYMYIQLEVCRLSCRAVVQEAKSLTPGQDSLVSFLVCMIVSLEK